MIINQIVSGGSGSKTINITIYPESDSTIYWTDTDGVVQSLTGNGTDVTTNIDTIDGILFVYAKNFPSITGNYQQFTTRSSSFYIFIFKEDGGYLRSAMSK